MADKTIGELPSIAGLYDDSLIPVEQQGVASKMTGKQFADFGRASVVTEVEKAAAQAAAAEKSRMAVENMTVSAETLPPESAATAEKTTVGGAVNIKFGIPQGKQGPQGEPGGFAAMSDGLYGLDVVDDHLILGYTGDEAPPLYLENGHLIADIPPKIDLGKVVGDKGDKGEKGDTGAAAGFGTLTATVDNSVGTPSVAVAAGGPDTAKVFGFAFKNLKGEKGDKGETGEPGPQGPAGDSFAFTVEDGRLIMHYTNGEPPDMFIQEDGHLYMNIVGDCKS